MKLKKIKSSIHIPAIRKMQLRYCLFWDLLYLNKNIKLAIILTGIESTNNRKPPPGVQTPLGAAFSVKNAVAK
ncbi:hypothetical protein ACFSJW_22610 [Flavobacterium artemisiae]|uniref:Uncharacterized protein n=1 Tax=Flavobacterium artemisiae TaxID=2126556 RepID=A0ABW4H737_9FLAO